eukprot:745800-Hanusia_phi.AAC.1
MGTEKQIKCNVEGEESGTQADQLAQVASYFHSDSVADDGFHPSDWIDPISLPPPDSQNLLILILRKFANDGDRSAFAFCYQSLSTCKTAWLHTEDFSTSSPLIRVATFSKFPLEEPPRRNQDYSSQLAGQNKPADVIATVTFTGSSVMR